MLFYFFFDPDKPGTTGETLGVLTNSLKGQEHKLHIILNKVDQFKKIHDFARAYGSLCWNLSKVIHRKDLPRIYTMYTPVDQENENINLISQNRCEPYESISNDRDLSWSSALKDLENTRKDVINEVLKAPNRRIDNIITHLNESAKRLHMHLNILQAVRIEYESTRRRIIGASVGVGFAGVAASLTTLYIIPSIWKFATYLCLTSIMTSAGLYVWNTRKSLKKINNMSSDLYLRKVFSKIYKREIKEEDQSIHSLWNSTHSSIKNAIETIGIVNLPRVSNSNLKQLHDIINNEVPSLLQNSSPLHRPLK